MKLLDTFLARISGAEALDAPVRIVVPLATTVDDAAGGVLDGSWLGHPLHPPLTDIPIGFWTSSFVLDFVGGKSARRASQRLIGLGVLSVVPTAAAGLVDWRRREDTSGRRLGIVHAASNSVATLLYIWSWRLRRKDRHATGVLVGVVAGGVATIGAALGGHLAFGSDAPDGTSSVSAAPEAESATATAPPPEDHELDGKIGA